MSMPQFAFAPDASAAIREGSGFDAVVAVGPASAFAPITEVAALLDRQASIDAAASRAVRVLAAEGLAGGRLIASPVSSLGHDHDDVRRFADAASAGAQAARDAGAKKPLLLVAGAPSDDRFQHTYEASLLGAAQGLWEPLEAREARGEDAIEPVTTIGLAILENLDGEAVVRAAQAIEVGRRLARDLGGTEPERMRPEGFAAYCVEAFSGTGVHVQIEDNLATLERDYPLLFAVARASVAVPRHHPKVIKLEYRGEGPIERTLLLAGKGLTYDTGGADIKAGGAMAGMSRDKGGGAAVAGFLRTVAAIAPRGLRVVAEIGAVRNSVGADCFVSDEIITAHCGTRVRIGNTDAEGRLVLADLLSHLREQAVHAEGPEMFSVATLTGHAVRAVGPYSIAIDNGPARAKGTAMGLMAAGDAWGEGLEVSRLRREDWDFVRPRSKADDTLSCNNAPSSATSRGHQFPMAFLCLASGLDHHDGPGEQPIPYTHLDVGGGAMEGSDWQHGRPTAAPLVALAAHYLG